MGGQKKLLNSFAFIRKERDGKQEVCAEKLLMMFRWLRKEEGEGEEFALVRYMECVSPLDEMGEAL